MLILARKSHECVIVGNPNESGPVLTVTVLGIQGGTVKLGFDADRSVPIHRFELWKRMYPAHLSEEHASLDDAKTEGYDADATSRKYIQSRR